MLASSKNSKEVSTAGAEQTRGSQRYEQGGRGAHGDPPRPGEGCGLYSDAMVLSRVVTKPNLHFERGALTAGSRIGFRIGRGQRQECQGGGYDSTSNKRWTERKKP